MIELLGMLHLGIMEVYSGNAGGFGHDKAGLSALVIVSRYMAIEDQSGCA